MNLHRYIRFGITGILLVMSGQMFGQRWTTHFAYNNVTHIALTPDLVYALSDGSLYSVDKQTEKIRVYNRQNGLHATDITCIHYDDKGEQLFIGYATGKIDIITSNGVNYIGELYDKDMTQRKTIYNVTIHGRTAYISTHFGIQTFDLRENKLVDTYWLRPNSEETPIKDVLIQNDSIYAFASDSMYCASLKDNIVDYTFWKRELRSNRVTPDKDKGNHYIDGTDEWYAGLGEGIIRYTVSGRLTYKPEGPLNNNPYRMTAKGNQVWVVQGSRWSAQDQKEGIVMHYANSKWTNINAATIRAKTGRPALDFMNIAVDPRDEKHYFVTSYGTGLYEFYNDELTHAFIAGGGDNSLTSAAPDLPNQYTRIDNATFDKDNNLWLLNAGSTSQLQCIDASGQWHALDMSIGSELLALHTPGGLIIDNRNANYKWIVAARYNTCICLLNDNGTRFDISDDQLVSRSEWVNQHGHVFKPNSIRDIRQDTRGRVWIGTDQGVAYFPHDIDYFNSNAIIQPDFVDNNGENPLTSLMVLAICQDSQGQIWLGTDALGVYVLSADANEIVAHYTTENSSMPSNYVMSLACDGAGVIYVGTSEGLAAYDAKALPTEDAAWIEEEDLDMGAMKQWKLHYSYLMPDELVYAQQRIYALSSGALFSVDTESEELQYWNKSTGLTGTTIRHIAYDESTKQLIIGYIDGRVDLLDNEGGVRQLPDLSIKANSVAVTINSISIGQKRAYLAMPFGIVALNTRKAEVEATYYIGAEASAVDVQYVIEHGDSVFAFTTDAVYSASVEDDLVNYVYWNYKLLPSGKLQQAFLHRNELYTLQHDTLYRRSGNTWKQVTPEPIQWAHASNGKLMVGHAEGGTWCINENNQLEKINDNYSPLDAIYRNGEYWLGITAVGLVRLSPEGSQHFEPVGPMSNFGYSITSAHDHMYIVPGGRWASQFNRFIFLSISNGMNWRGRTGWEISSKTGAVNFDAVSVAVDPRDKDHYFLATYGAGVFEFLNSGEIIHYDQYNSSIRPVNNEVPPHYFTRTDGALMDEQGNFWVLNSTSIGYPLHLRTSSGQWIGIPLYDQGKAMILDTPGQMIADNRKSQRKWFINQRVSPGVYLFDDNGTPSVTSDDRCIKRSSFTDQNGTTLTPDYIYCIEQDHSNRLWIGTATGVIIIPANVDFFTSDACRRIIIPRNDGTGLGDYLLGNERINCMAVDGGNRMWIGTANSGLYLIEDDTITVAHFTETNSLLPSNSIQSIAIMETSGEVYVGTDNGIASYRSDASEPKNDLSQAYAFPNPVRPNYGGAISIAGLMENTVVNIIDAGGNLVCKTRSHGGLAVWDGNLPDGRRATPGIYTALCNANGGHTVVKILVVR